MKKTLVLACVLMLSGLSNNAFAADGEQGFVRAEIGTSDVDIDLDDFDASQSDDDTVYSLRGGYWYTPNFGFEMFYSNLYDEKAFDVEMELSGWGAGAVAKKNFGADGNGFFIGGRLGLTHLEGKISNDIGHGKDSSTEAYAGVGVGYDFSDIFGLSLNYDFHQADVFDADVDAEALTLGGEVRF